MKTLLFAGLPHPKKAALGWFVALVLLLAASLWLWYGSEACSWFIRLHWQALVCRSR